MMSHQGRQPLAPAAASVVFTNGRRKYLYLEFKVNIRKHNKQLLKVYGYLMYCVSVC